ncbi:MAG: hypothetical protein JRH18_25170 [Deltaproteobacteria bacterium]|nr:hypothetical protein [Deltaproteobacteria bacterium]MBW2154936.1 hypothetical protein [Deltaproteobacteria bacterium]
MPNIENYDLEYRPESYWGGQLTGFTSIKGEMRRRIIRKAVSEGRLDTLSASLFSDALSEKERLLVSRIHPFFMGAEYLPSYLPTEVEIARVSLNSVTWDVISVRTRLEEDGLIHYRIADEYMEDERGRYRFSPDTSELPLTMGEQIHLMDTAELLEPYSLGFSGLTTWRDHNYEMTRPDRDRLESLVHFVAVDSDFYPDLHRWYEEEALEWYTARLAELK